MPKEKPRAIDAGVRQFISIGAEGGNRTRTPLKAQDFKSWASTNSATPARIRDYHNLEQKRDDRSACGIIREISR